MACAETSLANDRPAIAFADNAIADEENDTLTSLAEGLGIDEANANTLLDAVEADLAERPASSCIDSMKS